MKKMMGAAVAVAAVWLAGVPMTAAGSEQNCRSEEHTATRAPGDGDYARVTAALRRFIEAADPGGMPLPRQFFAAPGVDVVGYTYSVRTCHEGPRDGGDAANEGAAAAAAAPLLPGSDAPEGSLATITTCAAAVGSRVEFRKTEEGWTVDRTSSQRVRSCASGGF